MAAYYLVYYLMFRMLPAAFVGIYSYFYIRRILGFYRPGMKKTNAKVLSVITALGLAALAGNFWSTRTMLVLHVTFVSILTDAVAAIFRRLLKKRKEGNRLLQTAKALYRCGILPVVITAGMLGYGFFNMGHVVRTEYWMETEKGLEESYRLVLITDTHYGTIQDTELLKEKAAEISLEKPDVVILCGDIVEENTSREHMEEAFQVLGSIESRYGVYYVYGNHDRQPYTDKPTYGDSELADAARKNGIVILEDKAVELGEDLLLAGRADAAWGNLNGRASVEELLKGTDRERFIIVADHQPVEAEENATAGVDLLVSGHTHAGQIWPIGVCSELFGTLNYGEYQEGDCRIIVSSGFTGWGYPFRTEEHCEYVVITLK
ncbi:MAG: hypothetical protein HFI63_02770 [Lachnospiraceae bacterium]|nr:hypothetical protein [Lachnospiraceae bacterium]